MHTDTSYNVACIAWSNFEGAYTCTTIVIAWLNKSIAAKNNRMSFDRTKLILPKSIFIEGIFTLVLLHCYVHITQKASIESLQCLKLSSMMRIQRCFAEKANL